MDTAGGVLGDRPHQWDATQGLHAPASPRVCPPSRPPACLPALLFPEPCCSSVTSLSTNKSCRRSTRPTSVLACLPLPYPQPQPSHVDMTSPSSPTLTSSYQTSPCSHPSCTGDVAVRPLAAVGPDQGAAVADKAARGAPQSAYIGAVCPGGSSGTSPCPSWWAGPCLPCPLRAQRWMEIRWHDCRAPHLASVQKSSDSSSTLPVLCVLAHCGCSSCSFLLPCCECHKGLACNVIVVPPVEAFRCRQCQFASTPG